MKTKNTQNLFQKDLVNEALKQSFIKLDPRVMIKNPIMFLVEVGTVVMFVVTLWTLLGDKSQGSFGYNFTIFITLFLTVLFANFAEAIAEARGKAQADTLRKTREETPAKLILENKRGFEVETVQKMSAQMQLGDIFLCVAGDQIPMAESKPPIVVGIKQTKREIKAAIVIGVCE